MTWPKEGELWRNKKDGKIYIIKNIHKDRRGYPWFRYYEYNPSTGQEAADGTASRMPLKHDDWHEDWERYETSGSGGGSSSVSTPKKKSLALFPDGPLDVWRKKAASEKI